MSPAIRANGTVPAASGVDSPAPAITPVLHVLHSLEIGGVQRQLMFLMQALDRRRFPCTIACDHAGPLAPVLADLGVDVVLLRGGRYRLRDPRGWVSRWRQIASLARQRRIAIVHSHAPWYGLFGAVAGWLARVPVRLLSIHAHWLRPADRVVLRVIGRLLTRIVEGTPGCIDRLVARGLDPARFALVDYGVDGSAYGEPGLRERGRRRLEVPADACVVMRIARCFPDKGVDYVVEAAARVLPEAPHARFVIVGDGADLPMLEARARALGVSDRVLFTGFCADLPEVLAAADVVTMTSRIDELSLATLDALAAAKPMVAFRNGHLIAEAVHPGKNGVLLPPGDVDALTAALVRLARDPALRAAMGAASRDIWAEKYGLEAFGRRMGALYHELATASGTPAAGAR